MTRFELLKIVLGRARSNGFEFRRWYTGRLGLPWISADASLTLLEAQRRYYALLFSHEFALAFWKPGSEITFSIAAQTFQRRMPDGSTGTVHRKSFIRRSARPDAWRYHLGRMALAPDPLRYLRRYLNVAEDEVEDEAAVLKTPSATRGKKAATRQGSTAKKQGSAVKKAGTAAKKAGTAGGKGAGGLAVAKKDGRTTPLPRPLPTGLPAFLRRPYP